MSKRDPNWEYFYARHLYDACARKGPASGPPAKPDQDDCVAAARWADAASLARLKAQIDPWPTKLITDLQPGEWYTADDPRRWEDLEGIRIFRSFEPNGDTGVRVMADCAPRSYLRAQFKDGTDWCYAADKVVTVYPTEIVREIEGWR